MCSTASQESAFRVAFDLQLHLAATKYEQYCRIAILSMMEERLPAFYPVSVNLFFLCSYAFNVGTRKRKRTDKHIPRTQFRHLDRKIVVEFITTLTILMTNYFRNKIINKYSEDSEKRSAPKSQYLTKQISQNIAAKKYFSTLLTNTFKRTKTVAATNSTTSTANLL